MIQQMEWQPIKTAPKDGTHILAYAPNAPRAASKIRSTWYRTEKDNAGYIGWGILDFTYPSVLP